MKNVAAGVVLVLLTIASAGAQPQLPVVTVHVEIFGAFGERYPGTQVLDLRLLTEDRKREYRGLALDGTIRRVPYGKYILVASSRGGGAAERKITVNTRTLS